LRRAKQGRHKHGLASRCGTPISDFRFQFVFTACSRMGICKIIFIIIYNIYIIIYKYKFINQSFLHLEVSAEIKLKSEI